MKLDIADANPAVGKHGCKGVRLTYNCAAVALSLLPNLICVEQLTEQAIAAIDNF